MPTSASRWRPRRCRSTTRMVPRRHGGRGVWDADDGARARAPVVRRQRRAVRVGRPVDQRGPRHLVRVRRRGERRLNDDSEKARSGYATSKSSCRPSTRTATSVAPTSGPSRGRQRDPPALQPPGLLRWSARPVRAAAGVGDTTRSERIERAWVAASRGESAATAGLHRARLAPSRAGPERVPERVGLRDRRRRRCPATPTGRSCRSRRGRPCRSGPPDASSRGAAADGVEGQSSRSAGSTRPNFIPMLRSVAAWSSGSNEETPSRPQRSSRSRGESPRARSPRRRSA